ncbi:MAG: PKD domain-containing protein, partial [Nanoarchaeota archaeon]|nr:PKD domain-containing protein [Nanoarchaeota archaeon]
MRWDYAYILLVFLLICTPVGAECPPLRIDLNDLSLREGDTLLRDLGPDGVIYSVAYVNSTITNIGLNSRTGIINFTPEKKHKGEHTLAFVAVQGTCISSKLITLVVKVRPKILIFEPEQEHIVLQEGMFKRFYAEADGANLAYSWYVDNDYKDIGQEFMFTPNYYDSGSHEIRLEVKDAQDLSSIITWTVNV